MDKHRRPPQPAWYSSSADGSFDYNANPFAKKRKPSVYPEPDSEEFVDPIAARRWTFADPKKIDTRTSSKIEAILSPLQKVDEETASPLKDLHGEQPHETSNLIPWKQRIFLFKRHWRSHLARLGLGRRWEDGATSTSLRVIYVQDDDAACEQLILDYHINSPAFSRSRTDFREWIHGQEADHLSVWQTSLWRPSYDRAGNMVRAAFGLQYLVPQLQPVSVLESHSRFSKKSRLKAVVESPNDDVHDNSLQRLSVYIQVPRDPATSGDTMESTSEAYNSAIRSMTNQDQQKARKTKLSRERTVVILDSRLKAIATAPLIAGEEPWQQMLEDFDEQNLQNGCLALAVVGLAFEAVAARWVHYILCMHNYIASLEERVYENPADDSRTSALWSVSKQLLQAERLLKFHILLLENIQNDFGGLLQEGRLPSDWLRPNLDEFKRLSSEVEETLKKPTAHMVDLVSAGNGLRPDMLVY
ncbi:MAG: hypothetical protein Q9169_005143 [Polycauliona sp. 2 TL-2023]